MQSLQTCPSCRNAIEGSALFCGHCGTRLARQQIVGQSNPLENGRTSKHFKYSLIIILLGSLVLIALMPLCAPELPNIDSKPPENRRSLQERSTRSPAPKPPKDCLEGEETWETTVDKKTGHPTKICGIWYRTVKTESKEQASVVGRFRTLLIRPGHSRKQIGRLIQWHYNMLQQDLNKYSRKTKQIFIYVYDDQKRIDHPGVGSEFRAMASAVSNSSLSSRVEPRFKFPAKGAVEPSSFEDTIYLEYMKIAATTDTSEEKIKDQVADRNNIKPDDLEEILIKVMAFRGVLSGL